MTLTELIQPVQHHFDLFQEEYQCRTHSTVPLLKEVEEYLNQFPGKRLRPLLVLLAAETCGTLDDRHIIAAAIVEMLHNATLMHDDVVDESPRRRGHDSVRHRWSNQVAVLCGDYYLAQTMSALHEINDTRIVNNAVRTMCEGELKQLATANCPLDAESYIDIIGSKTASLLSAVANWVPVISSTIRNRPIDRRCATSAITTASCSRYVTTCTIPTVSTTPPCRAPSTLNSLSNNIHSWPLRRLTPYPTHPPVGRYARCYFPTLPNPQISHKVKMVKVLKG